MHERWLILAVLTFARAVLGFQFQSVAAVAPFLLDAFHMSYAALGTVIGLYLLPGTAVALPGGILAQRYGDKVVACAGLAAMTLGSAAMGAGGDYAALVAGRVLSGCGAVLFNVVVTKMVTDWFSGREIATALGILMSSWPIGIAAALVALPSLAQAASWPLAMDAAAALAGIALVLVAASYRAPTGASDGAPRRFGFGLPAREVVLAILGGLVWTFFNISFIIVLSFGLDFLIASGYRPQPAAAAVSTASWIAIPAIPIGAWLAERAGRPDATMVGCLLAVALAIWGLAAIGPSLALIAAIGLLFAPPAGLIMTLAGQAAPAERRAVAMGVFLTCYYLGMGILPPLAGYARDLTGNAAAPLWLAGAMAILAALCVVQFRLVQARQGQKSS